MNTLIPQKTAFVYFEVPEEVKYFLVAGDYRHLNGVYVNLVDTDKNKEQELVNLMFDEDTGKYRVTFVSIDDITSEIREGAYFVEVGFIL